MPTPTVLIVDPDAAAQKRITDALAPSQYQVLCAFSAEEALEVVREERVHMLVVDYDLPRMNGLKVIDRLRRDPRTSTLPILMLSKLNGTDVRLVQGLNAGADDFMFHPIAGEVLSARVGAALRRSQWQAAPAKDKLACKGLKVDLVRHAVTVKGKGVKITPKEFEILIYFMRHPDIVLSKRQIFLSVWGLNVASSTATVERQVESLRKKLGLEGRRIVTLPKVGYRFESA